jgi:hypothetical protein
MTEWIAGIVCITLSVILVFLSVENDNKWIAFRNSHECHPVAHIDGSTFNTFGTDSKGNMTVGIGSTSAKTGWLCNDGMTYYKDSQ